MVRVMNAAVETKEGRRTSGFGRATKDQENDRQVVQGYSISIIRKTDGRQTDDNGIDWESWKEKKQKEEETE